MDFQITGKVEKILDVQTFSKKDGSQGKRFAFVLSTVENGFSSQIVFNVMDEEKWQKMAIVIGATYNVGFSVSSREWNGKYFTECKAYKAYRLDSVSSQPLQPQTAPQPSTQPSYSYDMPF